MRTTLFFLGLGTLIALVVWNGLASALLLRDLPRTAFKRSLLLEPAQVVGQLVLAALCVGLGYLSGLSPARLGWLPLPALRAFAWGAGLGVALPLFFNLSLRAALRRWGAGIYSPVVLWVILPRQRREWLLLPLMLALAALVEELLFRSLWIGGLGHWLPVWLLVLSSSLVFGLLHLPQGRLGILLTGLAGIGFSLLFVRTGNLWPVWLAHFLTDIIQLVWGSLRPNWLMGPADAPAGG